MMTDTIADMLTRIRNAISIKRSSVDIPLSNENRRIARILMEEGYVDNYEEIKEGPQGILRISLRYLGEDMVSPINGLQRVSRAGRRVYRGYDEIPEILGGLGVAIVSTNKGIMTGREAAKQRVGGEVLCSVW
jgi:small subunit ribosomal protein S8